MLKRPRVLAPTCSVGDGGSGADAGIGLIKAGGRTHGSSEPTSRGDERPREAQPWKRLIPAHGASSLGHRRRLSLLVAAALGCNLLSAAFNEAAIKG